MANYNNLTEQPHSHNPDQVWIMQNSRSIATYFCDHNLNTDPILLINDLRLHFPDLKTLRTCLDLPQPPEGQKHP